MNYNYKLGTFNKHSGFVSHFGTKLVAFGIGGAIGFYLGAVVAIGQLQASPLLAQEPSDTAGGLTVQPVGVTSYSQFAEPSDFQPALGYVFVQYGLSTQVMQPVTHIQNYQPTARYGVFQHTVTDYQLQGEQLKLN